jgi:hypothetical protein
MPTATAPRKQAKKIAAAMTRHLRGRGVTTPPTSPLIERSLQRLSAVRREVRQTRREEWRPAFSWLLIPTAIAAGIGGTIVSEVFSTGHRPVASVALVASIVFLVVFSLPPLHKVLRRSALLKEAKQNVKVARRVEEAFSRIDIPWHVMRDCQAQGLLVDAICIGSPGAFLVDVSNWHGKVSKDGRSLRRPDGQQQEIDYTRVSFRSEWLQQMFNKVNIGFTLVILIDDEWLPAGGRTVTIKGDDYVHLNPVRHFGAWLASQKHDLTDDRRARAIEASKQMILSASAFGDNVPQEWVK